MNIIIASILLASSVYVGFVFANKSGSKELLFRDTLVFLESIKPKISFFQKPIIDILKEQKKLYNSRLYNILDSAINVFESSENASTKDFEEAFTINNIDKSDVQYYVQLFSGLGRSDIKSQLASIDEFQLGFKNMHSVAFEEKNKFCTMYKKVGVLVGIMLFVVAI